MAGGAEEEGAGAGAGAGEQRGGGGGAGEAGASAHGGEEGASDDELPSPDPAVTGRRRFAMVCASNMNRSMEAHHVLREAGLITSSYGIGNHVKLPGPTQREPNTYDFGTPYAFIRRDLRSKDEALYTRNGLLRMLDRNVRVKRCPERFQDSYKQHDVIVCFEQRVFDIAVETLNAREQESMESVLMINLQTTDNPEEAEKAGKAVLTLCRMIDEADDWEEEIEDILDAFVEETGRRPLYTVCFY
eukprot:PRCOL_00006990-RA